MREGPLTSSSAAMGALREIREALDPDLRYCFGRDNCSNECKTKIYVKPSFWLSNENNYLVDKLDISVGSGPSMLAELNFEESRHIRDTHKDVDKEWLQCLLVQTYILHILA